MNDSLFSRTLSLAAVFQAASLVKQCAKTGRVQDPYFKSSIESLFKIDAKDVPEIFGGKSNLALGLQELIQLFSNNKNPKDSDIARYVFSLLHLERKFSKNMEMQGIVQTGIKRAKAQSEHFFSTHENVLANLAGIYTDTLSTFKFRIFVSGEPLFLNQNSSLYKIRALLLAGIRASLLWRQVGGKRWQLLLTRHSMIQTAERILSEAKQPELV